MCRRSAIDRSAIEFDETRIVRGGLPAAGLLGGTSFQGAVRYVTASDESCLCRYRRGMDGLCPCCQGSSRRADSAEVQGRQGRQGLLQDDLRYEADADDYGDETREYDQAGND